MNFLLSLIRLAAITVLAVVLFVHLTFSAAVFLVNHTICHKNGQDFSCYVDEVE